MILENGLWCWEKKCFVLYSACNDSQLEEVLRENEKFIQYADDSVMSDEERREVTRAYIKRKKGLVRKFDFFADVKIPEGLPEPPLSGGNEDQNGIDDEVPF